MIKLNNVKYAQSFKDRLFGLLLKSNQSTPLLFKTRFGIHTFFLKKPIDVVILNKDYSVTKLKSALYPNKLFFYSPKYYWVLELPENSISKLNVKKGTQLSFSYKNP
jgi:uncharacterized membrane protein (UPF0127 family)